ncbi:hypothetical protein AMS60_10990 [Bacillus sp. FJAT-21945]|nr:hypothetical protein AMS60_10990 [Bacillus sp. FJAT-21945]
MDIKYVYFDSKPDNKIMEGILFLHKNIFGNSDHLCHRMESKTNLLINIAIQNSKVIGYKIGYSLDNDKFYSWLGGVDVKYRNQGIASYLMEKQHEMLRKKGYIAVQTKTKNKWRSMLILNIKNGFDIIGTYTDDEGEPKIILEKKL